MTLAADLLRAAAYLAADNESQDSEGSINAAEADRLAAVLRKLAEIPHPYQNIAIRNAAEQFVASCKDGDVADLIGYYEEIFTEALGQDSGRVT